MATPPSPCPGRCVYIVLWTGPPCLHSSLPSGLRGEDLGRGTPSNLPPSLSLSLQIAVSDLEPEFREKTTRTTLFYNKGL